MTVLQGKGVSGGIAVGIARFISRESPTISRQCVESADKEWSRFLSAREVAHRELDVLYQQACRDIGESGAAIFEIHGMMLEDEDYNHAIERTICMERVNAEYAVMTAGEHFASVFSSMDDLYMRARAADVRDISERICRILAGKTARLSTEEDEAVILCALDLAPSETMQLDRTKIAAFLTELPSQMC